MLSRDSVLWVREHRLLSLLQLLSPNSVLRERKRCLFPSGALSGFSALSAGTSPAFSYWSALAGFSVAGAGTSPLFSSQSALARFSAAGAGTSPAFSSPNALEGFTAAGAGTSPAFSSPTAITGLFATGAGTSPALSCTSVITGFSAQGTSPTSFYMCYLGDVSKYPHEIQHCKNAAAFPQFVPTCSLSVTVTRVTTRTTRCCAPVAVLSLLMPLFLHWNLTIHTSGHH